MDSLLGNQGDIEEIEAQIEAQIAKNVDDLVNPMNEGYPVDPEGPYTE